jgi:hypothetical protein
MNVIRTKLTYTAAPEFLKVFIHYNPHIFVRIAATST